MIPQWNWERDARRIWHESPSAFWLRPTAADVLEMIRPYLHRQDKVGELIRRISRVIVVDDAEISTELAPHLDSIIAKVSIALDRLEKGRMDHISASDLLNHELRKRA